MATPFDLNLFLQNMASYNRQAPAPPALSIDGPLPPNTYQLRSPPFETSASNAPSGLPEAGVIPYGVPDNPVEPPAPAPARAAVAPAPAPTKPDLPPDLTDAEKVKMAAVGIGADVSTQQARQTKEEKAAIADRLAINKEAQGTAGAKANVEIQKADDLAVLAAEEQKNAEAEARVRAQREAEAQARAERAQQYLDAKRADYEQNGTIKDMFGGDSAKRVQAALMTGIGAFASARGSGMPNLAGTTIANELSEWHDREVSRIAQSKELLNMARDDQEKALASADVELRNKEAAMANVAAKKRAAILASYGAPEAVIARDEAVNKLKDLGAELVQKSQEGLRAVTTSSNRTQQEAKLHESEELAKEKGTAGKPATGKQSQETVSAVASINDGIRGMEKVAEIARSNPQAFKDYQAAHQKWLSLQGLEDTSFTKPFVKVTRAALAGLGTDTQIPASEEQYMPSQGALEIHKALKDVTTGIAKGYGGVITGHDTENASSTIGALAVTSPESFAKGMDAQAAQMKAKRDMYVKNTGINVGSTVKPTMADYAEGADRLRKLEASGGRGSVEWTRIRNALSEMRKEM